MTSTQAFELDEVVRAERIGRAAVDRHPPEPDAPWAVVAGCDAVGAAALAAARLAHNCGARVRVYLASPTAQGDDAYRTMLEVASAMDLPVAVWSAAAGEKLDPATRVVVGGQGAAPGLEKKRVLNLSALDPARAWQTRPAGSRPETFLHEVTSQTRAHTVQAVRELDRSAIEDYGLPGVCLMENAGIGACAVARAMLGPHPQGPALVVAGAGNNGGDGFVVARGLLETGCEVRVALLVPEDKLRGDAAANWAVLTRAGVRPALLADASDRLADLASGSALVVDGILGTGLTGEVRGAPRTAIEALNRLDVPILALDIPSGLHANTGEVLGAAVRAARTVTFAALKQGLALGRGPACAGTVTLADIGAPRALLAGAR